MDGEPMGNGNNAEVLFFEATSGKEKLITLFVKDGESGKLLVIDIVDNNRQVSWQK